MLYKFLHFLFGWDYVAWENSSDSGVARLHRDHMGRVFLWRYKCTKVIDIIENPKAVVWLTCAPDKWGFK